MSKPLTREQRVLRELVNATVKARFPVGCSLGFRGTGVRDWRHFQILDECRTVAYKADNGCRPPEPLNGPGWEQFAYSPYGKNRGEVLARARV